MTPYLRLETVALILISLVWGWTLASHLKTQQALKWWTYRRSNQLASEAEAIRDELMQDVFALRLGIEQRLKQKTSLPNNTGEDLVGTIGKLQQTLDELSNQLKPAYVEDSLPLAIQYCIESWRSRQPHSQFQLKLPTHWQPEPPERSTIILRVLDVLLALATPPLPTPVTVQVMLQMKRVGFLKQGSELVVKISYPDAATLSDYANFPDGKYLQRTFQFLTSGCSWRFRRGLKVTWIFQW